MIKVLQERRVKQSNYNRLIIHLNDLRSAALRQPGYISGETLVRGKDPVDVLVISTWFSEDHWKAWTTSVARIELNDIINSIIDGEAKNTIYNVPAGLE